MVLQTSAANSNNVLLLIAVMLLVLSPGKLGAGKKIATLRELIKVMFTTEREGESQQTSHDTR